MSFNKNELEDKAKEVVEKIKELVKEGNVTRVRVRKDECMDLPAITEEVRTIDLEPKAMKLYRQIEEDSYAELRDSEVTVFNVLTQILRLSQITGGHLTDTKNWWSWRDSPLNWTILKTCCAKRVSAMRSCAAV